VSFKRSDRVAEAIKREVSEMIVHEVKDPRIHFATVMDVELTDDLRFGKIFVSVMGTEEEKAETLAGLEHAAGFVRSEIGRRIRLRFTPEIRFYLDRTLDHAFRIEELLNSLKKPAEAPENIKKKRAPRKTKKAPDPKEAT
jgi:ribosome-binding factor A